MRSKIIGAVVLAIGGCVAERELTPITPCTTSPEAVSVEVRSAENADVLIVVDETDGMDAPRAALAAAMPRFLDGLARGDLDHDGLREATPMRSIHVAVASSDHGCRDGTGVASLARGPSTDARGIVALDAGDGTTADEAAAAIASTLATLGHDGCSVPRPSRTALDALWLLPPGDDGLLRPQGVLIVVIVTRQDDESAAWNLPDLSFARGDPDMISIAIVAGESCAPDAPEPIAFAEGVRVANEIGLAAYLSPLCADDDRGILDRVSRAIARCVIIGRTACLGTTFDRDDRGLVPASLVEVLPASGSGARFTHCSELSPSQIYERIGVEPSEEGDREVCRIRQLPAPDVLASSEAGWFWDDGSFGRLETNPEGCASAIGLHGTAYVIGAERRLLWDVRFTTEASEVACGSDADCTLAGLVAHACDVMHHVCVSPTCH